ncbi:MAG TPA: adenylate/guanylate cyclase domain-containing protein [Dehalococcoidia bacterium]|nr:adenylate/guanylate cyclase domain-containing protein [Dehalococcoidia bacterium]
MTAAAPAGSRVIHGTVMFTDIVGFTEFNALRGDDEAIELLALQESIVRQELSGDARIVKQLGDGLMLWFADACAAIEAGLALQERFEEESWGSDLPLWVRIGVHSGQQTARGDDLLGHDVNVAARIVDVANSGEVLASGPTVEQAEAVRDRVAFARLGPVVMKGIPTPVELYRAERK